MGLQDRDYTQADSRRQYFGSSQIRFNLPRVTPVVKWLLIVNTAIFLFGALIPSVGSLLINWFSIDPRSWFTAVQPWRLVSYQFLHGNLLHIVMNMLVLYFLGPTLERYWGSRRFLLFYLGCGVVGGLSFLLLMAIGLVGAAPLLGASGAILGVLAACAILFPQFVVFLIIFPMPIRVFAVLITIFYVVNILTQGSNAGGDAAHLGGMAAGAAYILLLPRFEKLKLRVHAQSWEKRMEESRKLRMEVDRILAKVHRFGLHSLSTREKRILKKATQEEIRRHQL
ncbi:MAG: rhomboid family intramembrane serine protease [Sedimentisphaerales bacterium]|nr:rhomboid family intramembrane serine protease [Sedimentisphaerales bacterium]